MSDTKYKKRAITQWDTDPCGAHHSSHPIGSNEFFADVENFRYNEYATWMLEAIGFNKFKHKKVLDLGCGIGLDAGQFEKYGSQVTGIDLSSRSLFVAKKRIVLGNLVCSDAENLPSEMNVLTSYTPLAFYIMCQESLKQSTKYIVY